jgi:hypothetical protein
VFAGVPECRLGCNSRSDVDGAASAGVAFVGLLVEVDALSLIELVEKQAFQGRRVGEDVFSGSSGPNEPESAFSVNALDFSGHQMDSCLLAA